MTSNAAIFLSGRLATLLLLMAVQVVIVRALDPSQYALYALAFGIFALLQVGVSFGIPKVIAQVLPRAGWDIRNRAAARLVPALIALRVLASVIALLFGALAASALGWITLPPPALSAVACLFILVTIVQIDLDAMAQALRLQRTSRNALVVEALVRLALLSLLYGAGRLTQAIQIMAISSVTLSGSSIVLFLAVRRRLREADQRADIAPLDRRPLRSMAWSAYMSSAAWFTTSPPVMRLMGGYFLAIHPFAAFSFAQALVLSIQRFTPASLLLPFVEPAIVRDYNRSGELSRLEHGLSLLIKIDMLVIGAGVIVTSCCGTLLVDWVTAGKYGDYAFVFPFLLLYIGTNSVYRSFEVAAIAVGIRSQLSALLATSLAALGLALALIPHFGLMVLLLCPIVDAACRLLLVDRLLHRLGVRKVVDLPMVGALVVMIAGISVIGFEASGVVTGAPTLLGMTLAAMIAYLGCTVLLRPLRWRELAGFGWSPEHRLARLFQPLTRL